MPMTFPLIPYFTAIAESEETDEPVRVDDVTPEMILKHYPNADPYRHLKDK
jgi:hypothetical protein